MSKINSKHNKKAFSLTEISIVITIIALISTVTFGVNTLIRKVRVNEVILENNNLQRLIRLFKEQYGMLPGDFNQAEEFWGIDCVSIGIDPCQNGNGDGILDTSNNNAELKREFNHMAAAGIIPYLDYNSDNKIDYRYRTKNSIFMLNFLHTIETDSGYLQTGLNHYLRIGARSTSASNNPFLTTIEAYGIDNKIDDGLPNYGKVTHFIPSIRSTDCSTTNLNLYDSSYTYNFSNTNIVCNIQITFDLD